MQKRTRFSMAWLVLAALAAIVVPAATATAATAADTPGWKADTSPVTLDWYVNLNWYNNAWGQYEMSRYITKKTGVTVNWIVPSGNEAEKLNTLLASGDLPDILSVGWWEYQVKQMIEGGLLSSLEELGAKYDPYFLKSVADPQALGWYRADDGKAYLIPNYSWTPNAIAKATRVISNTAFLVKNDLYEAIGKPPMKTPTQFLAALKAAKAKFPTLNGQPLITIGFHPFDQNGNHSFNQMLPQFLAISREVNGKLRSRYDDPEWVRWMKTFRKANEQGFISKDVFVDQRSQIEEKIAQGRYFSMLFQRSDLNNQQNSLFAVNPKGTYIAIDGPTNSTMGAPKLEGLGIEGWLLAMISSKSKHPDRAIRFLSYMISEEGQTDCMLGIQGMHWDFVKGKKSFLPEYVNLEARDNKEKHKSIFGDGYWIVNRPDLTDPWFPAPEPPLAQPIEWTLGKIISTAQYNNVDPPADGDLGVIKTKIDQEFGRLLPKLILASTDAEFDKLFSAFLKFKKDTGEEKLLAYQQQRVDENKKKLGIK